MTREPTRFLVLLGLLLVQISGLTFAQSANPDFAALEEVARKEVSEANIPGAAIAVVSGDRIIYAKGIGVSDVETGTPVAPDMLFRNGSITKMFTAALLVSLAEEKKISLNKPIGDYA